MFCETKASSFTYSWSSWLVSMLHVSVAHQKQVLHVLSSSDGLPKSSSKRGIGELPGAGAVSASARKQRTRATSNKTKPPNLPGRAGRGANESTDMVKI